MRSGFNFSPKTFLHIASSDVKNNIPGYINSLKDVEFNNSFISIDDFIVQFLRNHSEDRRLAPELEVSNGVKVKVTKTIDKKQKIYFCN